MNKFFITFILAISFNRLLDAQSKKKKNVRAKQKHIERIVPSHPQWDDKLDHEVIEERLRVEKVAHVEPMSRYLSKHHKGVKAPVTMLFVTLESGLRAVFKPGSYAYAEVAAYKASKALGLRLVPPTAIRTIDGIHGSLQYFVESPFRDLRKEHSSFQLFKQLDRKVLSDMKLFYFVFGQWDTHNGNQIIAVHNNKLYLALIDNAGMLHRSYTRYGDYSFIEKGTNRMVASKCTGAFPYHSVKTVYPRSYEQLKKIFGKHLPDAGMRRLVARKMSVTYCIWCNALWIKMDHISEKPTKTNYYYTSTLQALEKLDNTTLEEIWSDLLTVDKEQVAYLTALTLERRDQVLKAAHEGGIIL